MKLRGVQVEIDGYPLAEGESVELVCSGPLPPLRHWDFGPDGTAMVMLADAGLNWDVALFIKPGAARPNAHVRIRIDCEDAKPLHVRLWSLLKKALRRP